MQAPRLPRPALPSQIVCVLLVTFVVVLWTQLPAAGMYEYDSRFHIRYSEILRRDLAEGRGFSSQFPWWQETFLARQWADKDLLYHLLLIPFTTGDLESGGKAASLTMATALYLCMFLALRWARAPAPALWALALLLSSTSLLYRAGIVRSHVVAIAIALLGTAAIVRGSRAGVFLASAAYALTHIAWQLLPGIAFIHSLARRPDGRRSRWEPAVLSVAGTCAAVLINPYFPENVRLWWVQNVTLLSTAWTNSVPDLQLGVEMLPGSPVDLIYYNVGPALFTLAGLACWIAASRTASADEQGASTTLGVVTAGFLALSLSSRRFVEFWAPFSVLFAALAAGGWWSRRQAPPMRAVRRVAAVSCVSLLLAGAGGHSVTQAQRLIAQDPGRMFDTCSTWIRDHVPPGETVFTASWDEFPELFFTAPEQHYLVGLEPTFMYVTDPGRFELWRDIAVGRAADIHEPIEKTFRCRYLFAAAADSGFLERADYDPWLKVEARDAECGVYSLRPESPGLHVFRWHRDEGGSVETGHRGFVDVVALSAQAAHTAAVRSPCTVVRGQLDLPLDSGGRQPRRLGISTDDSVQIVVNGTLVFDSAAADAPSLDEVLKSGRERVFFAELEPGYNELAVTTCRAGEQWGFYLRVLDPP